jgi:hypothetical protein
VLALLEITAMPEVGLAFFGRSVQTCNAGTTFLAAITGLAMVISPFSSLELDTKGQAKGRNLAKPKYRAELP